MFKMRKEKQGEETKEKAHVNTCLVVLGKLLNMSEKKKRREIKRRRNGGLCVCSKQVQT